MGIDQRGGIAVGEVIFYIPVLIVSFILVLRHGFRRQAGWIFLFLLSNGYLAGSPTHCLNRIHLPRGQHTLDTHTIMSTRVFHLLSTLGTVGVILAVVGGVKAGDAKSQTDLDASAKYRHIGALLFVALYACICAVTLFCWSNSGRVLRYRRKLLTAITACLPFLFLRVLYSLLSAFSPSPFVLNPEGRRAPNPSFSSSSLAKFNTSAGAWGLYLVLSVLAECAVVLVYVGAGLRLPLKRDEAEYLQARADAAMRLPDVGPDPGPYVPLRPYGEV